MVVYRTVDGGITWATVFHDSGSGRGVALMRDATSSGTGRVALTGEGFVYPSDGSGQSWAAIEVPGVNTHGNPLYWWGVAAVGRAIWICGPEDAGIKRNFDGGLSWQELPAPDAHWRAIAASETGTVFAASDERVYRTTDDGLSWEVADIDSERYPSSITQRIALPDDTEALIATQRHVLRVTRSMDIVDDAFDNDSMQFAEDLVCRDGSCWVVDERTHRVHRRRDVSAIPLHGMGESAIEASFVLEDRTLTARFGLHHDGMRSTIADVLGQIVLSTFIAPGERRSETDLTGLAASACLVRAGSACDLIWFR